MIKTSWSKFLGFILMAVFIAGCSPAPKLPAVQLTYTPSPVSPTLTPEPTATASATATLTPSPTPLPGSVVIPVDTLGKYIPWLPLDENARPAVYYVGFNTIKPPFSNPLIRQAFAYSIDRAVIADMAKKYGFQSTNPATTLTPPQTLGRDLYGVVGINFDPQKAKSLIAQAGYTDPSSFPKVLFLVSYRGDIAPGARVNMASAMAEMWQTTLGIKVEVQGVSDDYPGRLRSDPPDLFLLGWAADYNDPANFLDDIFSTGRIYHGDFNYGKFSNPEFDELIDRAAKSHDPAERQELYIQAERILCETEAAVIPLFH